MREKVVYILGAGFSAPLGLPVMSTFLERSKDLFADEPDRFAHFGVVFEEIDRMYRAKGFLDLDLFNIEEILSILEMEDQTSGTKHRGSFTRYLADTVGAFTPTAEPTGTVKGDWVKYLFTEHQPVRHYCRWLAGLFGVWVRKTDATDVLVWVEEPELPDVGIISLNYDMVLEMSLDLINRQVSPTGELRFAGKIGEDGLALAKIHGSVDPLTIVPPTWQKCANDGVRDAWELAAHLLTEANQIRILGFSFPQSDTYVKYLLSLGAMRAPHLKHIDVYCLDPDGGVNRRFSEFVSFHGFRFYAGDIMHYLETYGTRDDERRTVDWNGYASVRFGNINDHHERVPWGSGPLTGL